MSDQRKFEQMMGNHVDRELQRKWMNEYEPRAVKVFSQPAVTCVLCGHYMHVNPEDGRNYTISETERKWSVHKYCANEAERQLDSATFKGRPR